MLWVHKTVHTFTAGMLLVLFAVSAVYAYPFGIKPENITMEDVERQYRAFIDANSTERYAPEGSLRLFSSNHDETTSEYMAYGLAFAAAMGDHETYKRLWKFCEIFIGKNHKLHTMPWLVRKGEIAGYGSAMDGCIEIVYSLDLAEQKWPGNGYRDAAKKYIENLLKRGKSYDGRWWWPNENLILPRVEPGSMGYHANYMSIAWLPRFTAISGDPRFAGPVRESWYKLLEYSYHNYALVGCSLMEDGRQSLKGDKGFCGVVGSRWDRFNGGMTRFQFRITMDYLLYGEERSKKWAEKLTDFWIAEGAEEDILNIRGGYRFTDGRMKNPDNYPTTISGAGVAAMATENRKILEGAWEYCKNWKMLGQAMPDGAAVWGLLIMSGTLVPAEYDPAEYGEVALLNSAFDTHKKQSGYQTDPKNPGAGSVLEKTGALYNVYGQKIAPVSSRMQNNLPRSSSLLILRDRSKQTLIVPSLH